MTDTTPTAGYTPASSPIRTLAVRITDDSRAQLNVIAQLNDRSVTEEIRRRHSSSRRERRRGGVGGALGCPGIRCRRHGCACAGRGGVRRPGRGVVGPGPA